jgi:hypothetical protein
MILVVLCWNLLYDIIGLRTSILAVIVGHVSALDSTFIDINLQWILPSSRNPPPTHCKRGNETTNTNSVVPAQYKLVYVMSIVSHRLYNKATYMLAGVTGSCGGKKRIVLMNRTQTIAM